MIRKIACCLVSMSLWQEVEALHRKTCRRDEIIVKTYQQQEHESSLKDLMQQNVVRGSKTYKAHLCIINMLNKATKNLHAFVLYEKKSAQNRRIPLLGCSWFIEGSPHTHRHVHCAYDYRNISELLPKQPARIPKIIAETNHERVSGHAHIHDGSAARKRGIIALAHTLKSFQGLCYITSILVALRMIQRMPCKVNPSVRCYTKELIFVALCAGYILTEQRIFRAADEAQLWFKCRKKPACPSFL